MRIDLLANPDGRIVARPFQYLGDDFDRYARACTESGAFYDDVLKAEIVPVEAVGPVVVALKEAGFSAYVDAAVETLLRAKADQVRREAVEFGEKVKDVEAMLKERGLSLYRFQVEGVAKLQASDHFLLADEMGLGKTIQALAALATHRPVLVVCPAAVKGVWAMEARKWRPDYRVWTLRGQGSFRWPRDGEIVITNYDVLPPSPKELADLAAAAEEAKAEGRRPRRTPAQRGLFRMEENPLRECTTIIFDEAHALKSPKARRTRRAAALCSVVRKAHGRVWLLTGTPILNRPPELWTLLRVNGTAKEAFPGGWEEFSRLFHGAPGAYGYQWSWQPSPEVIERIRRVSLKRRRVEVLPDLPRKVHRDLEVEIDEETRKAADRVLELLRKAGIDLDGAVEAATSSKAMGVAFEEMSRIRSLLAAAKVPAMLDVVDDFEEQEEPIVVFSAHRPPIDALGYREGWKTITGDTPPESRSEIVQQFQMGELRGLGVTIKAGGVGLTLTRAAHALFVDLEWTPALNSQAEDRLCRIGQTRGVQITRLVANHPLDERVAQLLLDKQRLIDGSTEAAAVKEVGGGSDRAAALEALAADAARLRTEAEAAGLQARPPRPERALGVGKTEWRRPSNPKEQWAAAALVTLDGAMTDGWSQRDRGFGHSVTEQFQRKGMLSARQWLAVFNLLSKYQKHIGVPPKEGVPA